MKKPVDKWRERWYSIKAVRETVVFQVKSELEWENKNHLTVRKKFLTSKLRYGKLIESPVRAANKGEACRADLRAEKFEKTSKKALDKVETVW